MERNKPRVAESRKKEQEEADFLEALEARIAKPATTDPFAKHVYGIRRHRRSYTKLMTLAGRYESGKEAPEVTDPFEREFMVKECKKKAYLDSWDLAESMWMYSKDIVGRGKDGLVKDTRYEFVTFLTSPSRWKMLQAARGSWKSSFAVDYATWKITREVYLTGQSNLRVLFASETLELATRNLEWARRLFERNEGYISLFGQMWPTSRTDGLEWGKWKITTRYRVDTRLVEPTVMGMSLDTERTGFHFDMIICDDLEAQRGSATALQIEKCWDFYKLLHSLLTPSIGEMVLVCTRWHPDDIYARLEDYNAEVADDDEEKFQVLKIPACDEGDLALRGKNQMKKANLRFPNVLPLKELKRLKRMQALNVFSCQYLLKPVPDEDKRFKDKYIRWADSEMWKGKNGNIYTTSDIAYTKESQAQFRRGIKTAYSVVMTVFVDEQWNYFVMDVFRARCGMTETIQEIYRQAAVWGSHCVVLQSFDRAGIEETLDQYGETIDQHLYKVWLSYPSDQSKLARIETLLEPRFRGLKMYLHPSMSWFLNDEYRNFPRSKFFDGFDCLCNVVKQAVPALVRHEDPELTAQQRRIRQLKAGIYDPEGKKSRWDAHVIAD